MERRHYGPQQKIVFITAITHAAIEACRSKLVTLMDAYRSIDSLPNQWLGDVRIEVVSRGNDHLAPPRNGTNVHVYAGTIYQVCLMLPVRFWFLTEECAIVVQFH